MAGCEAGIGGLQTRAHCEAARHDRPGEWTCDDVLAAQLSANQTHRPNGYAEPTPDETWAGCQPIDLAFRLRFLQTVLDLQPQARQELGLLQFRRKRFAPPVSRKITRFIS
jgi:hypothetical protein